MNTWLYPGWTQGSDNDKLREQKQCPNCGGNDNQSEDGNHRVCWEWGTRWSA
jgi:NADH pyrophosphatase NudC (nudix superfamily)